MNKGEQAQMLLTELVKASEDYVDKLRKLQKIGFGTAETIPALMDCAQGALQMQAVLSALAEVVEEIFG